MGSIGAHFIVLFLKAAEKLDALAEVPDKEQLQEENRGSTHAQGSHRTENLS